MTRSTLVTHHCPIPRFSLIILGFLTLACSDQAGAARPLPPTQETESLPLGGLVGMEISDIVWSGRYLWVATEQGLARFDPETGDGLSQNHWVTFTGANGLGRGAVSALAALGDTVWVGTVFNDTALTGETVQTGDGLAYSHDGGTSWVHLKHEQIFDPSRAGFEKDLPAQNPCFGLAIDGDTIWAVFWAGSSMRSSNGGRTWHRVLPDGADRIIYSRPDSAADSLDLAAADSLRRQTLVHRTFSVLAYNDTVWIGTAAGLARSFDGGVSWTQSRVRVDDAGRPLVGQIAGEWVKSIARQQLSGATVLWAGTDANGEGQLAAISTSTDNGQTWVSSGPTFAWNFAFTDGRVWASTDDGLFASDEWDDNGIQGRSWQEVAVVGSESLRGTFNGLDSFRAANGDEIIWVGAENGLGRSVDGGETWDVIAFTLKTPALDSGEVIGGVGLVDPSLSPTYAAPSPFAPSAGERSKIVYSLESPTEVTIDVFDYASRPVIRLVENALRSGDRDHNGDSWDGRDAEGEIVANGIYFYRISTDAGDRAFGKVVVLD